MKMSIFCHLLCNLIMDIMLLSYQPRVTVASCFVYKVIMIFLFVFVALRPMSTAMVIAGRSVHLTTLFPGQA